MTLKKSKMWPFSTRLNTSVICLCLLSLTFCVLLAGCAREHITEVDFEEVEFSDFVEPDFPFITTSLDVTDLGEGFPESNMAARCLAIQLGQEAYTCFDTDMLRWSVAWSGDFMPMTTMAQISYHDFFNKDNLVPHISGEPAFATGRYPGWLGAEPDFSDPRRPAPNPLDPPSGAISTDFGRWNGLYLSGSDVVLSYTASGSEIYEKPGAVQSGGETGFSRTFQIDQTSAEMTLAAAEVTDASQVVSTGQALLFYGQGANNTVTAVGLVNSPEGVSLETVDDRYAVVRLESGLEDLSYSLIVWKGTVENIGRFEDMMMQQFTMGEFMSGGPERWPDIIYTRGAVAPDSAAYVIDQLTLPIPNPWQRNVRMTDIAFFEDGTAAVSTFEGDVWLVSGIDRGLGSLRWKRFASGLYETQSIEIVDEQIYTFGRDGIVRLHDLNGDDEADYYENFSNLMDQSMETREWAFDMAAIPDGGFYVAKGGALDMGPRVYTAPIASGFRGGSHHSGVILKVSADGRSIDQIASGFRGPYLTVHPETGVLTATDQQGHFMPSTPIYQISDGDYYGVEATAHRDPIPQETRPLTWIPHNVDQSASSQVWVTSDDMGPLNGHLVHLSYGRPGMFKVIIDETANSGQAAVSVIDGDWPAPLIKGAVHPSDGQLYLAGFNLWGSNSRGVSTLIRLRHTGLTDYQPDEFHVRDGGIFIGFSTELNEEIATNPANFSVTRWEYERSGQYGSGRYNLDGEPGEEMLPVFSSHLSDDGRGLLLSVPNLAQVMQMDLGYSIEAEDGTELTGNLYFSVNDLQPMDLASLGFSGLSMEDIALATRESATGSGQVESTVVSAERGEALFTQVGCIGCHTVDGTTAGKAGPSLLGILGSEREFQDGQTITADEAYIRSKILRPAESTLAEYDQGMPPFEGILSDSEIESIITWLGTLSEE